MNLINLTEVQRLRPECYFYHFLNFLLTNFLLTIFFLQSTSQGHLLFNSMKVCHIQGGATTPFQVESEVSEDATAGQEGAAHAGEQMPV